MPTLLQLDSSADLTGSVSRALTARFAGHWTKAGPDRTVVHRDLHTDPPPHLGSPVLHWGPGFRLAGETADAAAEAVQQMLISELLAADVLLVGAPMYNWSVPSTLKAWIDHVHVPGSTAGNVKPLAGRPVVVVSSRGAFYDNGVTGVADAPPDTELPGLRLFFEGALGMTLYPVLTELTLAGRLSSLADRADDAARSLAMAQAEIDRLAAVLG